MASHIFVLRPTTKFFAKSFVFRNTGAKEGLKKDNLPGLGAGGAEFKIRRSDQTSRVFFSLLKAPFTQNQPVEFWQTGGLNLQVV